MTETVGWRQALPGDSSAHLIIVIFVIIIIVNSTITVIIIVIIIIVVIIIIRFSLCMINDEMSYLLARQAAAEQAPENLSLFWIFPFMHHHHNLSLHLHDQSCIYVYTYDAHSAKRYLSLIDNP